MEPYKSYGFPWVMALELYQEPKKDFELEMLWISLNMSLQCIIQWYIVRLTLGIPS
jgi:hypothetical protein